MKAFRLSVKRRLYAGELAEELGGIEDKEKRKALLSEAYDDLVEHYRRVIARKRSGSGRNAQPLLLEHLNMNIPTADKSDAEAFRWCPWCRTPSNQHKWASNSCKCRPLAVSSSIQVQRHWKRKCGKEECPSLGRHDSPRDAASSGGAGAKAAAHARCC